jgi:hypothetical protein
VVSVEQLFTHPGQACSARPSESRVVKLLARPPLRRNAICASACLTRLPGSPVDSALSVPEEESRVNEDQEALDFEPRVLPGAGGGIKGSINGGQVNASPRGFAAPHGPHSCSRCSAVWTGARTAHCSACHSTFATDGLFDAHRSIAGCSGTCRDPGTLTYRAGQRAGERVMFWRDGLWWEREMTDGERVAAFSERAP